MHISKLVQFILEKNGFEALQSFSGKSGIELARKENPSLIILDVMMPNMDGFEVARKLKLEKETKDIPILMLSSAAQSKDRINGIKAGASDYMTKPFTKEELVLKIRSLLKA